MHASHSNSGGRYERIRPFLFAAFFLGGVNGLVFEIIFRRLLHLSLGVTQHSVGTVLTIFMAGLGIGGILFGRTADRVKHPLRLYGLLTIGIGLLGLLLLAISAYLDGMYLAFYRALGVPESRNILIKTVLSGILLLPLTVLMGGTLPVLGKTVTRPDEEAGAPLGLLYGLNTLGGVVGTFAATFWLLGDMGTRFTMLLFALLSTAIGAAAVLLSGLGSSEPPAEGAEGKRRIEKDAGKGGRLQHGLPLIAFAVAGFVGLSIEVYWTRILAYVIGSHGYAFGIMLATFLSGLGLGSVVFSRVVVRVKHPGLGLGILQVLIGVSLLLTTLLLFEMRGLAGWLAARTGQSWQRFVSLQMVILFFLMILPTLLMGAVFPFVISLIATRYERLGLSVGRAYALNTLGSILGAAAGSFVLIQYAGLSSSLKISILLSIAMGLALVLHSGVKRPARTAGLLGGVAAVIAVVVLPVGHHLQKLEPGERLIFYREANSATVTVREDAEGGRMLSINGLDEVPVDPSSLLTFRVLAHLPLLLHPDPEEAMVLSLGGGITTSSVATHDLDRIDVVELCPPVVEAAELFEQWNLGVLRDPRVQVTIQDGRNYLLLTEERYDVITADATHPWSADSWILYTSEFYHLVRSRLNEGGLFCQWVPLHYLSREDFTCILRTMRTAFPYLSVWFTGSYVVALGSARPPEVDVSEMRRRMAAPRVRENLRSVGVDSPLTLFSLFLMDDGEIDRFTGEGPLNTDDRPFLEHSAARCFGRETTPENLQALLQARGDPASYAAQVTGHNGPGVRVAFDRLTAARNEMIEGRIATYAGEFQASIDHYQKALGIAPEDAMSRIFLVDAVRTLSARRANEGDEYRRQGLLDEAVEAYEQALDLDPSQPRALNGIGLLLFNAGRYAEALDRFDRALDRMPNQVQIRYNRVLALLKLGMVEEAEREIIRIEELEGDMNLRVSGELRKILLQVKHQTGKL